MVRRQLVSLVAFHLALVATATAQPVANPFNPDQASDQRDFYGEPGRRIKQYAPGNITTIMSEPQSGMRVLVGTEPQGPFMVLEKLESQRIISQSFLRTIRLHDGNRLDISQLASIRPLGWRTNLLDFEAINRQGTVMTCTGSVENFRNRFFLRAACSYAGNQTMCTQEARMCPDGVNYVGRTGPNCDFAPCPATPHPQPGNPGIQPYVPVPTLPTTPVTPAPVSNQELVSATEACKKLFTFRTDVDKCVNLTTQAMRTPPWHGSTINVLTACGNAFSFSSDRLECLKAVEGSIREPAGLVDFCKKNHSFGSDIKACLRKWAKQ